MWTDGTVKMVEINKIIKTKVQLVFYIYLAASSKHIQPTKAIEYCKAAWNFEK